MYSPAFTRAINFTLSEKIEGGYSDDPKDPGNWTGGAEGKGELVGTKFGVSAASYPTVDIKGLRYNDAVAIYHRDYWSPIKGDMLPPRLAIAVFDTAVNAGVEAAGRLLQYAVGTKQDGVIGPATVAAARSKEQDDTIPEYLAARDLRNQKLSNFSHNKNGWTKRLFYLAAECAR